MPWNAIPEGAYHPRIIFDVSYLDRWFGLEAQGTTVATEVRAGVVTFLTMAYILFVNPQSLSRAGLPAADVAVATALASRWRRW